MADGALAQERPRIWDIALWGGQLVLAGLFISSGLKRAFMPITELQQGNLNWADPSMGWWLHVTGYGLLLAALALVMPPLIRQGEKLVPATAALMALVMVISFASHLIKESAPWMATDLAIGALCGFVAWGRVYKVPY
jgi:hypothetical protein